MVLREDGVERGWCRDGMVLREDGVETGRCCDRMVRVVIRETTVLKLSEFNLWSR